MFSLRGALLNNFSFSTLCMSFSAPLKVSVQGISKPSWGKYDKYRLEPVTRHSIVPEEEKAKCRNGSRHMLNSSAA